MGQKCTKSGAKAVQDPVAYATNQADISRARSIADLNHNGNNENGVPLSPRTPGESAASFGQAYKPPAPRSSLKPVNEQDKVVAAGSMASGIRAVRPGIQANADAQKMGVLLPSQLFNAGIPSQLPGVAESPTATRPSSLPAASARSASGTLSPSDILLAEGMTVPDDPFAAAMRERGGSTAVLHLGSPSTAPGQTFFGARSRPGSRAASPGPGGAGADGLGGSGTADRTVPIVTRHDSDKLMRARKASITVKRDLLRIINYCIDNNCGEFQQFAVGDDNLVAVERSEVGSFSRSRCYVCMYNYRTPDDTAPMNITYIWLGSQANQITKGKAALLASQSGWSGGDHAEVVVEEGSEPDHFKALLDDQYRVY